MDTANTVHDRYGSWREAKKAATFEDGKFVVKTRPDHSDCDDHKR